MQNTAILGQHDKRLTTMPRARIESSTRMAGPLIGQSQTRCAGDSEGTHQALAVIGMYAGCSPRIPLHEFVMQHRRTFDFKFLLQDRSQALVGGGQAGYTLKQTFEIHHGSAHNDRLFTRGDRINNGRVRIGNKLSRGIGFAWVADIDQLVWVGLSFVNRRFRRPYVHAFVN